MENTQKRPLIQRALLPPESYVRRYARPNVGPTTHTRVSSPDATLAVRLGP